MKLTLQRKVFNTEGDRATIGELFIDGEFFCYTLEDEVRADGIKVYGKTAIPVGEYSVEVTYSPRFKRLMPLIYNTPDYRVVNGDVSFSGVRFHGGNTAENSHGCPLVAFNTDGVKIWGTAEKQLTAKLKSATDTIKLKVEVKPFNDGLTGQLI
jgi:hypothetical protein